MRYSGRDFSDSDLATIRTIIAEHPGSTRTKLSRQVCQALAWRKLDGKPKDVSCRVAMLRMQDDGLIQLPAPKAKPPMGCLAFTPDTAPQAPIVQPANTLKPLQLQLVNHSKDARLWNEYIHRYHYLGHKTLPGAQLRYLVRSGGALLALLGFGASAWQLAPRDRFIGWSHQQRQRNLHLVVNNARFLILPWVTSKNLASMILAKVARQLPDDWNKRYHYRPVLLETFVDRQRFAGTCYKAANWIYLGETKGRGKLGPKGKQSVPIKAIWVYPLDQYFRTVLALAT